ncbi:MAG: acyltransferase [Marmoricola sp.]|nr:acyltransferase [Marmoricola sp.]
MSSLNATLSMDRPRDVTPTDALRTGRGPTPPEGAPQHGRARELEGYRGLVGLTIVAFHVIQYAAQGGAQLSGFLAALARFETVDLLFVMSAYLLTLSYARAAINQTEARSAGQFLFRRAVRIVPLYWVGVTTVWALRNPTLPGDWVDLVEHLLFVQVFDQERIFYTLGPAWSMSLEVIFYLLLVLLAPLAIRSCARITSGRRRGALLLAGTAVLAAVPWAWNSIAFLVAHVPFDNWPVYFGPQARFGAFAAGMALAVVVALRDGRPMFSGIWPSVLRVTGLGVITVGAVLSHPGSWGQVVFHDVAALGWLLLLASTVLGAPGQLWSKMLSWNVLTWLGLISYSTYMWHEPVMMLLEHIGLINRSAEGLPISIAIVVLFSVGVGWVSFHVIERPTSKLRMLRDRNGRVREYYPELRHRQSS